MDELTIAHLTVGFSIILVGVLSIVIKPEKPNKIIGYRTKRSMKSTATWKFANDKFARLMLWNSLVTITIQIFTYFTMEGIASISITTVLFTMGIVGSFGYVEMQLKYKFNKDGIPERPSLF